MAVIVEDTLGVLPEVSVAGSSFTLSTSSPLCTFLFLNKFAVLLDQVMECAG